MTSRGCTKSYNRKISNSITAGSIQFDKLFRENANRPSAAKSAGTVGKWGITSFTSIRSTNVNGNLYSDIRGSCGTKRTKLDYGNQNTREKEIPCKTEETKSDINKPKKFFKSRSMAPTNEDSVKHRSQSFSNVGISQRRDQKQKSAEQSTTDTYKSDNDSSTETFGREEGKPPIVLRICKGTAGLICSDETDAETYRITTPSPVPKVNVNEKFSSQNIKSDTKLNRFSQHESTSTISDSCTASKSEMRTTRSRAKNLQLDITSNTTSTTPNAHNPGLSLTLRKSAVESNESHYDIVKTDCISSYTSKTDDFSVKSEEDIPASTQELIDILSNDAEQAQSKSVSEDNLLAKTDEINDLMSLTNEESIEHMNKSDDKCLDEIALSTVSKCETKNDTENIEHIKDISSCRSNRLLLNRLTRGDTMKNFDQDWCSSSDDSESASGNINSDIQSDIQCTISITEASVVVTNSSVDKPAIIKKGSIFKTRSTGATDGNKRRALYKHKWCDSDREAKAVNTDIDRVNAPSSSSASLIDSNIMAVDEEFENPLTRIVTYPVGGVDVDDDIENAVTSIRCGKKIKGFYTVVKNVKKAHQIQESGEFQEFNDDVEYILDTLRENNPNATRCLSAIRLASKCMAPAFRMHVRAHGTVAKFFKALHDATTDQSLALCTATVMFVLSQDRLAMDLDRDCLELMLSLLESDASHKNALDDCGLSHTELQKNKEKVRQLCADIQAQGHAKHLNLDNITVGQLAMETLLSLTSKRAGEWFKEELRELGGLEHIGKTITECHRHINSANIPYTGWNELLLDKLRKVDRCLRVLENVTQMNEENQVYLLKYNNSILVITLASLYNFCGQEIVKYPTTDCSDKSSNGAVIKECLFAVIKVLINLTHRFNRESFGGKVVGSQDGVIDNSLHLLLQVPQALPEEKRFDIMMLALNLLINIIEQCDDNKPLLIGSKIFSASKGEENGLNVLINLFYKQEELAREAEQKTDAILDGKKDTETPENTSSTSKSQVEFIEETVAKLFQKAGRHMEHKFIGAYVVLLLGYLIMDNESYENLVRNRLPDGTFTTMVAVLQEFFNFMNLAASNELSSCGIAATEKVIKFLKLSDARYAEKNQELTFGLENANVTQ